MSKPSRRKVAPPPNPVKPSHKETYPSNKIPYTSKTAYENEYIQLPNGSVVPLHDALPTKGAPPTRSRANKPRPNLIEKDLTNAERRPKEERKSQKPNLGRATLLSGIPHQNNQHRQTVVHRREKAASSPLKATKAAKKAATKALGEKARWQRCAKLLGYLLAIALLLLWLQSRRLSLRADIGEPVVPGQFSWVLRTPAEMLGGWKDNLTNSSVDWEGRFAAKIKI